MVFFLDVLGGSVVRTLFVSGVYGGFTEQTIFFTKDAATHLFGCEHVRLILLPTTTCTSSAAKSGVRAVGRCSSRASRRRCIWTSMIFACWPNWCWNWWAPRPFQPIPKSLCPLDSDSTRSRYVAVVRCVLVCFSVIFSEAAGLSKVYPRKSSQVRIVYLLRGNCHVSFENESVQMVNAVFFVESCSVHGEVASFVAHKLVRGIEK